MFYGFFVSNGIILLFRRPIIGFFNWRILTCRIQCQLPSVKSRNPDNSGKLIFSGLSGVSGACRREWIPDLDSANKKKLNRISSIRKILAIPKNHGRYFRISCNYRNKESLKTSKMTFLNVF